MAKLNYSESAPLASGKVGGQQIIKNRHGVILQSIVQPPKNGTLEQKRQRFVTNTISQKWKNLTDLQRQSYVDSALTYFKKSKTGQLINQTPYGLFLFLHQNSELLGIPGPSTAVDYQSLVEPAAYLTVKNQTTINVKSDNTVNDYEYLVIIDPRSTGYRVAQQNNELLVGKLTALELDQGIDVAPMIQNHFDFAVNMSFVSVRVTPIEIGTGRRGEEISWLYQLPKSQVLGQVYTGSLMLQNALAHNGSLFTSSTQGNPNRVYSMSPNFDINSFTLTSQGSYFPLNKYGYMFKNDGLGFYMQGRSASTNRTEFYELTTPYDLSTRILKSFLSQADSSSMRGLYIDQTGTIFIQSSNNGTYKYELTTANDLSTAVQVDFNPALKASTVQSYFFSNDGLIFILYQLNTITSYQLNAPYDLVSLTSSPIKSINVSAWIEPSPTVNRWMSMSYDGIHFTISNYNSNINLNNITMFQLASPFKLDDF